MEKSTLVFVGTYTEPILQGTGETVAGTGEGILVYRLDRTTGQLHRLHTARGERNPSYLAFSQATGILYAVNEISDYENQSSGAVSAFRLDTASGSLALLNRRATFGADPCHVCVNAAGTHVFAVNYSGGSLGAWPVLADGSLAEASAFIQHQGGSVNPVRQQGPHPHQLVLDEAGTVALVPDLGLDRVVAYRFGLPAGSLQRIGGGGYAARPGAGPRHAVFSRAGDICYLNGELDSSVSVLRYHAADATLTEIQRVSTLPEGFAGENSGAALRLAPDGRHLYASNRGHDSVAVFRVAPDDGTLTLAECQPAGGQTPRDFDIDPDGDFLIAASQDSGCLTVFRIDRDSGRLNPVSRTGTAMPVCVRIEAFTAG